MVMDFPFAQVVDESSHFPSWHFDAVLRYTAGTSGRGSPFHSLGFTMPAPIHPQIQYRERLTLAVQSFKPAAVLEIGCGAGAFMRSMQPSTIRVLGIDPDPTLVEKLRTQGFQAEVGIAESLGFEANAFDVVVFSYTAHHVENWPQALKEALRVARQAVVVLDPWYDERIPSQANTSAFDRWTKLIDRSNGMVHNDCQDAAALLQPLNPLPATLSARYEYMLILTPLSVSEFAALAETKLAEAKEPNRWRQSLETLMSESSDGGFSEDGAVLLTITKRHEA
jgi:SAM-dependent methyltransferase